MGRRMSPRMPPVQDWIKAILIVQMTLAAAMVILDLRPAVARLRGPAPSAAPGEQVRRYEPAAVPGFTPPPGSEGMPAFGTMPRRLQFRRLADGAAVMTGEIAKGDAARFADWLAAEPARPTRMLLHSPGGAVAEALAIGRALRTAGIATGVGAGDVCLSACPYILAGGPVRQLAADAQIGVHQHYFGENTALPAFMAVRDIQAGQARVVSYLAEMGIDLRLLEPALATPPDRIYILTPHELERFRLATQEGPP